MVVKIYDYKNNAKTIRITKPISGIYVCVLSGDETVEFTYSDGTREEFDACTGTRFADFYDGDYTVSNPEFIQKWIDYEPSENVVNECNSASYERKNFMEENGYTE